MVDTKPPAPAGTLDPQIAAILGALGNNTTSSADDPPIYLGAAPRTFDTELGRFHSSPPPTRTQPLSEYNKQFYAQDPNALRLFQQRAAAAGWYGNQTPRWGDYDDDTYKLWQDVGLRAARFYAAGQSFTTNDVLDMATQSAAADLTGGQGRLDVIQTQDPATLRAAAHAAFKAVTGKGRVVDDKKVAQFVREFTSAQTRAQQTVNSAQDQAAASDGGSTSVTYSAPDMETRAAEYARNTDPAGAGAHDIASKFAMFTNLLGGIV